MARRSSHGRLKAEINIVPYIDVMLVLLVIFMVTAPLLNRGEVDLPRRRQGIVERPGSSVRSGGAIGAEGWCLLSGDWRGESATGELRYLEPRLQDVVELMAHKPQPPVLARADREVNTIRSSGHDRAAQRQRG